MKYVKVRLVMNECIPIDIDILPYEQKVFFSYLIALEMASNANECFPSTVGKNLEIKENVCYERQFAKDI